MRLLRSGQFWLTLAMVVLLAVGVSLSVVFWDWLTTFWGWLQAGTDSRESPSTTIRNVGLVIAGLVALPLAIWRSLVAERQAYAAQRQADTAQQSLLNERYQQGAEMLGNEILTVRLGGIYALQRLAEEHPEQYHVQVMRLFSAFVRHPADDSNTQPSESQTNLTDPSTDIQAVMDAIGARGEKRLQLEKLVEYKLDLRRAKLRRASLGSANLSDARLSWACLEVAALGEANLSSAILNQANLTGATLGGAKLIGASLHRAILKSAVFWNSPGPLRFITYYNSLGDERVLTADLSGANLEYSDLTDASLQGSDLSGAILTDAVLSSANLSDATLSGTTLVGANLSGVIFSENGKIPATGLIQGQLDQACADPDNPPKLDGVVDAKTGKQLVWRGKPLNEEA